MNQYLIDTEYATKSLFAAITHERDKLADLVKARAEARAKENALYGVFLARQRHPSVHFWYAEVQRAAGEKNEKELAVAELELRIADREFSASMLCGAILQIAKQGISIVWGEPEKWPKTREVFGQDVAAVIRGARNQALHWEEGAKDATAEPLLAIAEAGGDQRLKQAKEKINLAAVVLDVLGWKDYDTYLKDMAAILG